MSDSQRPIELGKQLFATTLPKYVALIVLCCTATLGYTQVATTEYVDAADTATDKKIAALAEAQTATAAQVKSLAESTAKTDKRMNLIVRLVKIQYIEHVDAEEALPKRQRNRPRSSKAKRIAAALQIDPDDPLAGLELLVDEANP